MHFIWSVIIEVGLGGTSKKDENRSTYTKVTNLKRIRRAGSETRIQCYPRGDVTNTLMQVLITSRIDYYNTALPLRPLITCVRLNLCTDQCSRCPDRTHDWR